jgi:3-deoxy-D-manno-octulosonate 8-phosphate phosphatase (KDO 8-P phosphatase)
MSKLKFILDVDGVLTTGQFLYSSDGKAYKIFGPHDADGLKMIQHAVDILLISADHRGFSISQKRAEDMGFPIKLVLEKDRYTFIKENFGFDHLIFMGDGIHDAPIIRDCMFGIAPANARKEARQCAHFVTESKAGEGAVLDACLEIIERYLKKEYRSEKIEAQL